MFARLRRLLTSEDGKAVTITTVLMRDDCTRLFGQFADHELKSCCRLIIIGEKENGDVKVATSASCDSLRAVGLLSVAKNLIMGNGKNGH